MSNLTSTLTGTVSWQKDAHVKYIILLKINKTKAAKILGLLY